MVYHIHYGENASTPRHLSLCCPRDYNSFHDCALNLNVSDFTRPNFYFSVELKRSVGTIQWRFRETACRLLNFFFVSLHDICQLCHLEEPSCPVSYQFSVSKQQQPDDSAKTTCAGLSCDLRGLFKREYFCNTN